MTPKRWVYGELDSESGNFRAQRYFLARVDELVPEVLDELRNEALPLADANEEDQEEALQRWAERWELDVEWVIKSARNTVNVWLSEGDPSRGWSFYLSHRGMPIPDEFHYSGWRYSPFIHRRAAFKEAILEEVEEQLEAYMDRVEDTATEEGSLRKSAPTYQQRDHFDWMVLYQVDGMSYSKVANHVGRSRSTVTSACRDVSDLIALPLREPDQGGRPEQGQ